MMDEQLKKVSDAINSLSQMDSFNSMKDSMMGYEEKILKYLKETRKSLDDFKNMRMNDIDEFKEKVLSIWPTDDKE